VNHSFAQSGKQSVNFEKTSNTAKLRIINGKKVTQGQYPWMVALLDRYNKDNPFDAYACGASLIHSQWVLTAAHCVSDLRTHLSSEGNPSVWINHLDLTSNEGTIVDVEQTFIHPYWKTQEYDGDIALLKLTTAVNIPPVELTGMSFDQYNYAEGQVAIVMGWGGTEVDGDSPSPELLEVDVPIVDQPTCNTTMKVFGTFDDKMLCAGLKQGGKDSCYGDSGGPLVVNNGNKIEQIGVVSAGGTLCAQPDEYGTYTRIESYADWISDTMCTDSSIVNEVPQYTISVDGQEVSIAITSSSSTNHRLYYAPFPERQPTTYIDLTAEKTYATFLPPGSQYIIGIRGYDGPCTSQWSSVENFIVQ